MKTKKSPPTSIRLSEEAAQLRKLLARRLGVSEAAVIELAIRELAEKKGLKIMTNEEMRNQTLKVVQLSEKAPVGIPGPLSWGGGQDGVEMVTFQQEDGWHGYERGTKNGLYSEGEDQGPFNTREDAEQELRSQYEESLQPAENIYPEDL